MVDLHLFYCYDNQDKRLFKQLDAHLSSLKREFQITTSSQYEVSAGMEIKREVDTHLNTADIVLLLISANFVASDYCYTQEMTRVLQRQKEGNVCVIPILLRPVEWKETPFSKLQPLPTNGKPVILWSQTDAAFQDIAIGIRKRLEKGRGKLVQKDRSPQKELPNKINTQKDTHTKKVFIEAEPDQMKHYLYVSDTKIRNLEQQVVWPAKETPSFQERLHSLNLVLAHLQKRQQLRSLESGQPLGANTYISGKYLARWGTVNWGMKVCFFFVPTPAGILLMAGSVHHLPNNQHPVEHSLNAELTGASGSDLPGILSAIEFAAEQSGITWSNGISNLSDYLFALALIQGKFFHQMKIKHLSTAFPEQMIEFTALILKTLHPPSQQQLTDFFVSNALPQHEQEEIKRILQKADKILICTPLYVALGNEP
jgi:TIR domain